MTPPRTSDAAGTPGPWGPFRTAVLAAVPLLFLVTWLALLGAKGPYWLGSNSDSDYAYLLNGLGLAYGQTPGHVDHPGTPVQVLVALVLRGTHSLLGGGTLADDVLQNPEPYLYAANGLLLVLFACALGAAGLAALRTTGSLLAGLAVEILPGLAPIVAANAIAVKAEPFLAALTALLAAQVLRTLAPDRSPDRGSDAVRFGVLVGLALAAKVSSAPLVLLPLLVLKGRAARLRYGGVAALTFALATLPAWPAARSFRSFLLRIATHSGQYGSGKPSLFSAEEYIRGLRLLATEVSGAVTIAVAAAGVLVALALTLRARRGDLLPAAAVRDALVAAIATQAASFLFVARHAANHYLLPAFVITGLTAALVVHGVRLMLPRRRVPRWAAAAALACLLALYGSRLVRDLRGRRADLISQRDAQLAVVSTLAERFPGARVIHFYRSSSPAYALHFGDLYDWARWSTRIQRLYPRHLFYNRWVEQIETFGPDPAHPVANQVEFRPLTTEDLCGVGGADPAVVQGSLLPDGSGSGDVLRARLEVVYSSGGEALYRPLECPAAGSTAPR